MPPDIRWPSSPIAEEDEEAEESKQRRGSRGEEAEERKQKRGSRGEEVEEQAEEKKPRRRRERMTAGRVDGQ